MNVHRETNAESLAAACDRARELWDDVLDRERAIEDAVCTQVEAWPLRYEEIVNERDPARRVRLIRGVVAQRIAGDKKIKDLTGEYDRTVATATMYGVARLAELFGDGVSHEVR